VVLRATVLLAGIQGYRTPGLIAGFWRLVERYALNYFSAVPTVYASLLEVPVAGADVSSLHYAICGAAPMPPEVFRRFEQLTGLRILEGYGLTEATCATCVEPTGRPSAASARSASPCRTRRSRQRSSAPTQARARLRAREIACCW